MGTNVLESSKKKKKTERKRWRKKREKRAAPASAGTFLNKGEKKNKRRGIEIRTTCGGEKQEIKKKKKNVWMK